MRKSGTRRGYRHEKLWHKPTYNLIVTQKPFHKIGVSQYIPTTVTGIAGCRTLQPRMFRTPLCYPFYKKVVLYQKSDWFPNNLLIAFINKKAAEHSKFTNGPFY